MTTSPSSPLVNLNTASLADAAQAYASRGWPVLPLKPRDKTPYGKLVHNGNKEATTNLATVARWWETAPDANIGLLTGPVFDVLDLDGPDAITTFASLAPGYKHSGPVSATGKGYHLLFEATGSGNHAKMSGPIDYRGVGGYIVASPSVHPSGHLYQWVRDGDLPAAPDWLERLIFPPKPERTANIAPEDIAAAIAKLPSTRDLLLAMGAQGTRRHRRGITVSCPFPWHEDSTPSLAIYEDTDSFKCFGCEAWGDPLNIQKYLATGDSTYVHVR